MLTGIEAFLPDAEVPARKAGNRGALGWTRRWRDLERGLLVGGLWTGGKLGRRGTQKQRSFCFSLHSKQINIISHVLK